LTQQARSGEKEGAISTQAPECDLRCCREVLVVDDERTVLRTIGDTLVERGFSVTLAETGAQAIEHISTHTFDIVVTDLKLPDADGIDIVRAVKAASPSTGVIVITAYGSIQNAVQAIREGARHYITKPFDLDELMVHIERLCEHATLAAEYERMRQELEAHSGTQTIAARSAAMRILLDMVGAVASSDASVVIHGESGTGKELIARNIHQLSERSSKPLIVVNCSAVPEALAEAELFGVEKGAYTGADAKRDGRFIVADGGTLFLDEIGDLPQPLQAKLLRVLEQGEVERLGSNTPVPVDVRVIVATHRDLHQMVEAGEFRADLLFRLDVVTLKVPPLRERVEDIPMLAHGFLEQNSAKLGRQVLGLAPATLSALCEHHWPGNVRELQNVIQRAVLLCREPEVQPFHLPPGIVSTYQVLAERSQGDQAAPFEPLADAVARFERAYIERALGQTKSRKSEAARLLGISRKHLWQKLKRFESGS